jgi:hypothetical protein
MSEFVKYFSKILNNIHSFKEIQICGLLKWHVDEMASWPDDQAPFCQMIRKGIDREYDTQRFAG